MTVEFFHRQLRQQQNDPLFRALDRFRRLDPRRAANVLTTELVDEWWPWKPERTAL